MDMHREEQSLTFVRISVKLEHSTRIRTYYAASTATWVEDQLAESSA